MGSFGGVKIDAQNFQQTVEEAQQKALLEPSRTQMLSQNLTDYRNGFVQSFANNMLVNSEKLLRRNVSGVLNQDVPYNLLLKASEQEANRVAYDKWKIEVEKQRLIDLQKLKAGSKELFFIKPFVGNNLPYKQGGILKSGTRVQGDLYAQDLRPVDGNYNEWLVVKVPNSFGGEVRVASSSINYDSTPSSDNQYQDHKLQLIIIGAFVLGILLSDD
jgi:hypothetical protein